MNISRIESGRAQFDMRPVDPAQIVQSVVESLHGGFEQKGLRLQVDCATELLDVQADSTFIAHALGNLLANALKFTPPGGNVTIGAENDARGVKFFVRDTGAGIPLQFADRIFDKFFRIPRADGPAGVGLGLAIAKEIIEAHGGQIHFHPNEGGGSVFWFTLPAVQSLAVSPGGR